MDELVAIELLKKVLLGERKEKTPHNSIKVSKTINTTIDPEQSCSNHIRRRKIISAQERQDGRIACLATR